MIYKIKKIRPLFNQIVVTKNIYSSAEAKISGLYTVKENKIKEYQTVLAVGPMVKGINVGDVVKINPARYAEIRHREGKKDLENNVVKDDMHVTVNIPSETVYGTDENGNEYSYNVMFIYDNDVHFVIEEGEEFDETPILASPDTIIK